MFPEPCKAICEGNNKSKKGENRKRGMVRNPAGEYEYRNPEQRQLRSDGRSKKRKTPDLGFCVSQGKEGKRSPKEEKIILPMRYIEVLCENDGHRIKTLRENCCATIRIFDNSVGQYGDHQDMGAIMIIGAESDIEDAKRALYKSLFDSGIDFKPLKSCKRNEPNYKDNTKNKTILEENGFDANFDERRSLCKDPEEANDNAVMGQLPNYLCSKATESSMSNSDVHEDYGRVFSNFVDYRRNLKSETIFARKFVDDSNKNYFEGMEQDWEKEISKKEISIQKELLNAVTKQVVVKTSELLKADQTIKEQKDELAVSEKRNRTLHNERDNLIIERDQCKGEFENTISHEKSEKNALKQKNEVLHSIIAELNNRNKHIKTEFDLFKQQFEENKLNYESIILSKTKKLNETEYELDTKKKHYDTEKERIKNELDEKIKNGKIENKTLGQQKGVLQNLIKSLEDENKKLKSERLEETKQYVSKTKKLNEYEFELNSKTKTIHNIENKLVTQQEEYLVQSKATDETIRTEKEMNKSLGNSLIVTKYELENKEKQVDELKEELELKTCIIRDKTELMHNQEIETQGQMDKWRSKQSKAENVISKQKEELKLLETKFLKKAEESENIRVEKDQYKRQFDERIHLKNDEIQTLNEKLRQKTNSLDSAQQVIKNMNIQKSDFKNNQEISDKKFQEIKQESDLLKKELLEIKQDNDLAMKLKNKDLKQKEFELRTKNAQCIALKKSIESLKEEFQMKIKDKNELSAKEEGMLCRLEKENESLKRYKIQMKAEMILTQTSIEKVYKNNK